MGSLAHVAGESEGRWCSEEEKEKVREMRALVEKQDPSSKEELDSTLRRFLQARDWDMEKAYEMFSKYMKWRRREVPNGFISETEVSNELAQKKLFAQGFDRKGCPIGVILGGRHQYTRRDLDEFRRVCVYGLDKLCSRMPTQIEKFTFIADVKGWRYANCDIRAYTAAIEIMQNYYPERLNKVFIVHAPYLFMKAWKIIYPFIDNTTKNKFIFVDDKNIKRILLQDIEENQLPEEYGGKIPLVPVEDA